MNYQGPPEYSPENLAIKEKQDRARGLIFTAKKVKLRPSDMAISIEHDLPEIKPLSVWMHLKTLNTMFAYQYVSRTVIFKPLKSKEWVKQVKNGDKFQYIGEFNPE